MITRELYKHANYEQFELIGLKVRIVSVLALNTVFVFRQSSELEAYQSSQLQHLWSAFVNQNVDD